jgi:hypothetical protein
VEPIIRHPRRKEIERCSGLISLLERCIFVRVQLLHALDEINLRHPPGEVSFTDIHRPKAAMLVPR